MRKEATGTVGLTLCTIWIRRQ